MTVAARIRRGVGTADGTVAAAMVSAPKTSGATATVAHVREVFQDDHVHCVLIVERGVLLAVIERCDIADAGPAELAASLGRLGGRVIGPHEDLEATRLSMLRRHRRRLAVADDRGALLGLLCLKRTGLGFCSDADVRARAAEREDLGDPRQLN